MKKEILMKILITKFKSNKIENTTLKKDNCDKKVFKALDQEMLSKIDNIKIANDLEKQLNNLNIFSKFSININQTTSRYNNQMITYGTFSYIDSKLLINNLSEEFYNQITFALPVVYLENKDLWTVIDSKSLISNLKNL